MSKERKTVLGVLLVLIFSCTLMYFIEVMVKPGYFVKSVWKCGAFVIIPLIYCAVDRNIALKDFFMVSTRKQLMRTLALGVGVYVFILCGYLALAQFIDLNNIATKLSENLRVNKDNFIFVALYISFINSLLEEFFFRGFAFLSLNKVLPRFISYTISAFAFSAYHIAILTGWFSPWLFATLIVGLFISGLFFNWLNEKSKNIYNSWIVHISANFAINTIGLIMFMG